MISSSIDLLLSSGDGGRSQYPHNLKLKVSTSDYLKCSHCGGSKCFKLHGYPYWWADFKDKKEKKQDGVGSFEANSSKGFENINTSSGKTTIAAIEPIFSIARQ